MEQFTKREVGLRVRYLIAAHAPHEVKIRISHLHRHARLKEDLKLSDESMENLLFHLSKVYNKPLSLFIVQGCKTLGDLIEKIYEWLKRN